MITLYTTLGLPGVGKTTLARRWRDNAPSQRFTCSRDDVRTTLGAGPRRPDDGTEQEVTRRQAVLLANALDRGKDAMADDANLWPDALEWLARLANLCLARYVVVDLTGVGLEEALRRNRIRPERGRVPEGELRRLAEMVDAQRRLVGQWGWRTIGSDELEMEA